MTSNALYKSKYKIKFPIINLISNADIYVQPQNNLEFINKMKNLKLNLDNKKFSNLSFIVNPKIYYRNNCNNKISSIPKTGYINQINIYKKKNIINNINKSNKENISFNNNNKVSNNNNKIVNILKSVYNINKKLRKNNSINYIDSKKIYKINEKNRKKLFEKYFKFNYSFNNIYYRMYRNSNKIQKKENYTSFIEMNDITKLLKNKKANNLNKTQPNFSKGIIINKIIYNNDINLNMNDKIFHKEKTINNENKSVNNSLRNEYQMNIKNKLQEVEDNLIKSNGRFNYFESKNLD